MQAEWLIPIVDVNAGKSSILTSRKGNDIIFGVKSYCPLSAAKIFLQAQPNRRQAALFS